MDVLKGIIKGEVTPVAIMFDPSGNTSRRGCEIKIYRSFPNGKIQRKSTSTTSRQRNSRSLNSTRCEIRGCSVGSSSSLGCSVSVIAAKIIFQCYPACQPHYLSHQV